MAMYKQAFLRSIVVLVTALTASSLTLAADAKLLPGKIIVGGASGGLGRETVEALLERGVKPSDLILVTRTPDNLARYAGLGAAVRKGDYNDPASLPAAFAGGNRLLIISTNGGGDRKVQHKAAIDAAKAAGVKLIAYTSYVKNDNGLPTEGVAADHRATEEALKRSGVPYVVLANQLYNAGLINQGMQAISRGEIVSNAGDGKWAPVARTDCAAAAAAVLSTPGHENKFYNITGPDLISHADFAKLLTEVTGKPVKYVALDDAEFIRHLTSQGVPETGARRVADFNRQTREGQIAVKSTAVKDLTGKEPQSVLQFLQDNKARLVAPPAT
jgi:NAD(P)H dehydrogenase (quinone)